MKPKWSDHEVNDLLDWLVESPFHCSTSQGWLVDQTKVVSTDIITEYRNQRDNPEQPKLKLKLSNYF